MISIAQTLYASAPSVARLLGKPRYYFEPLKVTKVGEHAAFIATIVDPESALSVPVIWSEKDEQRLAASKWQWDFETNDWKKVPGEETQRITFVKNLLENAVNSLSDVIEEADRKAKGQPREYGSE